MTPTPPVLNQLNHRCGDTKTFTDSPAHKLALGQQRLDFKDLLTIELSTAAKKVASRWPWYVLVSLSVDNISHRASAYSHGLSDLLVLHATCRHIQHFPNLSVCQQRSRGRRSGISAMQTAVVRVLNVIRLRNPLQVFKSIVRLDTVDVIRVRLVAWRWANKSFKHQSVNYNVRLLDATANRSDRQIAACVFLGFKQTVFSAPWTTSQALDSAKSANGVKAFPP